MSGFTNQSISNSLTFYGSNNPRISESQRKQIEKIDKEREVSERKLANFYDHVRNLIRDYRKTDFYLTDTNRRKIDLALFEATRAHIQRAYQLGGELATSFIGLDFIFTNSDIELIKELTYNTIADYWRKIQLMDNINIKNTYYTQRDQFLRQQNIRELLKQTGVTALSSTISKATIHKLNKLKQSQIKLDYPIYRIMNAARTQEDDDKYFKTILNKLETRQIKLQWVARNDEKTCITLPNGSAGCRYLDGMVWNINDPDIPTPAGTGKNPTHYNCRCKLVPVEL